MALVTKDFESTVHEGVTHTIQFKTLPPMTNFKYKTFILEILLPMSGVMFDSANNKGDDDLFQDKSTMFKDLFSHLSTMLSDQRVINLLEDMLKGAQYECQDTCEMKPLKINEFFDDEVALMDKVFMYLLEVNFKHLFTQDGILQLLQGQTINMISTSA